MFFPLLVLLLLPPSSGGCPPDIPCLPSPGGGCVCGDTQEVHYLHLARERCREVLGQEGVLMEIFSAEDQSLAVSVMREAEMVIAGRERLCGSVFWWSDLRDVNNDNVWVWPQSGLEMTFSAWSETAQTNDTYLNCMQLNSASLEGSWQTFFCDTPYSHTFSLCQTR